MPKRKFSQNSDTTDNGFDLNDPPSDPTELSIWICGNINSLRATPYEHGSEGSSPTSPTKRRHFGNVEDIAKNQEKRDSAKMRKAKSRARPSNWLPNKRNDIRTRVNANARARFGLGNSPAKDAYLVDQFQESWVKMIDRSRERLSNAVGKMTMFSKGFDEHVFPRDDQHSFVSDSVGRLILRVLLSVGNTNLWASGNTAARCFVAEYPDLKKDVLVTAFEVLANHLDVQDAIDMVFKTLYVDRDHGSAPVSPVGRHESFKIDAPNPTATPAPIQEPPAAKVNSNARNAPPRPKNVSTYAPNPGFSNKPAYKLKVNNKPGKPARGSTPASQMSGMFSFRLNGFKRSRLAKPSVSDTECTAESPAPMADGGEETPFSEKSRRDSSVKPHTPASAAVDDEEMVLVVEEPPSRGRTLERSQPQESPVPEKEIKSKASVPEQPLPVEPTPTTTNQGVASKNKIPGPEVNTIISTTEGQATSVLYRRISSSDPATPTLTNDDSSNHSTAVDTNREPTLKHYSRSEYYWYKAPNKLRGTRFPSPGARLRSFKEKEMDDIYGFPPEPGTKITINVKKLKKEPELHPTKTSGHDEEQEVRRSGRKRQDRNYKDMSFVDGSYDD